MISSIVLISAFFMFVISILVLFLGKGLLRLIPAVRQLENDEVFVTKIIISHKAIDTKGETLAYFTNKVFTVNHVQSTIDNNKMHFYADRYKIGQIIKLAFYYNDKKLDKAFKVFKAFCLIIFLLGLVILGAAYTDNVLKIDTFSRDYLKFLSLSQILTFIILLIDVVVEINKIEKLFDPQN